MVYLGNKYATYYAKHLLENEILYFIVNLDISTDCYSIIPIEQQEYDVKIKEPAKAFGNQEDGIEKNDYNTISQKYYQEEDIVDLYFQDYLNMALYNIENAYNLLNETYKEKKFGNIENYKTYIENNKKKYEKMCKASRKKYDDFETYKEYEEYYRQVSKYALSKYNIKERNGKTEYICIDTAGAYYIFDIDSIMDYKVILDTYTIDLPEFIEKYNSSTDAEKVLLNIQKVVEAINDGDYRYVYNKLDPTFRQNNFPKEADFENYIKQNFYKNNSIGYSNYKTSGDLHIYDISFKDKENESNPPITKTFIMQLKEGTDFVMSFNVN